MPGTEGHVRTRTMRDGDPEIRLSRAQAGEGGIRAKSTMLVSATFRKISSRCSYQYDIEILSVPQRD